MEEVTFHGEPPSNLLTMVVAFGGWIDAGEAATGALRYLVRQLGATPLASIDPEDFCDFTQLRPVVRLSAEGERTIRWPRSAFWMWQPPQTAVPSPPRVMVLPRPCGSWQATQVTPNRA